LQVCQWKLSCSRRPSWLALLLAAAPPLMEDPDLVSLLLDRLKGLSTRLEEIVDEQVKVGGKGLPKETKAELEQVIGKLRVNQTAWTRLQGKLHKVPVGPMSSSDAHRLALAVFHEASDIASSCKVRPKGKCKAKGSKEVAGSSSSEYEYYSDSGPRESPSPKKQVKMVPGPKSGKLQVHSVPGAGPGGSTGWTVPAEGREALLRRQASELPAAGSCPPTASEPIEAPEKHARWRSSWWYKRLQGEAVRDWVRRQPAVSDAVLRSRLYDMVGSGEVFGDFRDAGFAKVCSSVLRHEAPEAWPVEDFVKEAKSSMDMLYRQVLLHPDMYKVFYWGHDCFVAARVRRLSPRELPVKKKTVGKLVPVKVSRSRSSRRRRTRSSS